MHAVLITDANLSGTITKTFHTEDEALEFEHQVLDSAGTWFEITENQTVLLDNPATTLMTEDEAIAYGFI